MSRGWGADGGTVFIPNSELSEIQEHAITPWNYFHIDAPTDRLEVLLDEYQLPHTGLDFESMEWVLGDDGEKLTVYDALHGHVWQPGYVERTQCPQLPLVDFGRGVIRDPDGKMRLRREAYMKRCFRPSAQVGCLSAIDMP